MAILALMGNLSIRILSYSAPRKGFIDGFKRGEEALRDGLDDRLDASYDSASGLEIRKPPSLWGGEV